jgi:serine/threonine-protein kinase
MVPVVIGRPYRDAQDAVANAGFRVKRVEEYSTIAPAETVFEQAPRSGEAEVGSEVTLKVSLGRPQATVPEVRGMSEAEARAKVEQEGLKPAVSYEAVVVVPAGSVFATEPPPGAVVDRGTVIRLRVRRDPTPAPPTPTTPRPAATPGQTPAPAATGAPPTATSAPPAAQPTRQGGPATPGRGGQAAPAQPPAQPPGRQSERQSVGQELRDQVRQQVRYLTGRQER